MSDAESLKEDLSRQLKFVHSSNEYRSAAVLVIYWKVSDHPGFAAEATTIGKFLREELGFFVEKYAIPAEKSQLALEQAVINFILKHDLPSSLMIVHYGGHGDRDDDHSIGRQRQSVWAAFNSGSPTVDWFEIQKKFINCTADVVLILDCCFSAQAGRGRGLVNNVELLAASAMGVSTPPPGEFSFTTALVREMRSMINEQGRGTVKELHTRLVRKEAKLSQTPFYVALNNGDRTRSIYLKPLIDASEDCSPIESTMSSVTLRVSMRHNISKQMLPEIADWLKRDAPPTVSKLAVEKVIIQTDRLRRFVTEKDAESGKTLIGQLDKPAKEDILAAWDIVKEALEMGEQSSYHSHNPNHTGGKHILQQRALEFFKELNKSNSLMFEKIRSIVLASPQLEEDALEEFTETKLAQDLGLSEPLRMRMLIDFPSHNTENIEVMPASLQPSQTSSRSDLSNQNLDGRGIVLVEYKICETKGSFQLSAKRVEQLAKLMNTPKSVEFRSMKCLHWFQEEAKLRFGLVFEVPPKYEDISISLNQILLMRMSEPRATLGQRFNIALSLARAVQSWHDVSWVHQSVRSGNVVFFNDIKSRQRDYSAPYLTGFEYSRPSQGISLSQSHVGQFESELYRHPQRQGIPDKFFRKEHDLYSLGVVLLEIGLWQAVEEFFPLKDRPRLEPCHIQQTLHGKAKKRLSHYMGTAYRDAVCTCLAGDFGVEEDNHAESNLGHAFQERVIRRLEYGLAIDGGI